MACNKFFQYVYVFTVNRTLDQDYLMCLSVGRSWRGVCGRNDGAPELTQTVLWPQLAHPGL